MRPTQKKYILENHKRFSTQQLAIHLNLREKAVADFLNQELKNQAPQKKSFKKTPPLAERPKAADPFLPLLLSFSILCWGLILYSNSFQAGFHYDDKPWIVNNLAIRDISNIGRIWNFSKTRFLTALSFALNYHFGELRIFGYHLLNVAIHILASLGVFFLARILFQTPRLLKTPLNREANLFAWSAALIFLSHPVQTQAVTYIVQRAASLAALFYVWAVFFYAKYRLRGNLRDYFLSLLAAVSAMFSKEISFTLPLMILIYEAVFHEDFFRGFAKKIPPLLPFFLMLGIIPASLYFWRGEIHSDSSMLDALSKETEDLTRTEYLLTEINVIRTYLRLLFLPVKQHLDYHYPLSRSFWELRTLLSFGLLTAIFIRALKICRKFPSISFGIFWFFIALAVESSIIPIRHVIFEHRVYLPAVGFSIALSTGLWLLFKQRRAYVMVCAGIVICLSVLTYNRNHVWSDELSLWAESVKHSPGRVTSLHNLGTIYLERGENEKALKYFQEALRARPDSALTYNSLGVIYRGRKEWEKAEEHFQKAIQIDPNHFDAFINLGSLYFLDKRDLNKALFYYRTAVQKDSSRSEFNQHILQYELGLAYYVLGDFEKALECAKALRKLEALHLAAGIEDLVTGKSGTHYFTKPYTTLLK